MKSLSTRKIVLLSLIAVLALVYVLQLSFTGKSKIVDMTLTEDIDRLEIVSANGTHSLVAKKTDGKWFVGEKNYLADDGMMTSLVNAVKDLKLLGVAASSSSDAERYGLGEGEKLVVTAYKGEKVLRTLNVGKNTSTNSQSYVQVDGKNAVSLASGALHTTFSTDADKLRSKQVYSIDSSAITKVTVNGTNGSYTLQKSAPQVDATSENGLAPALWVLSENNTSVKEPKLDDAKVGQWVTSLASLNAASWADDDKVTDAAVTVTITAFGNDTVISFAPLAEGENETIASCSQNPYGFKISKSVSKRYDKSLGDLAE